MFKDCVNSAVGRTRAFTPGASEKSCIAARSFASAESPADCFQGVQRSERTFRSKEDNTLDNCRISYSRSGAAYGKVSKPRNEYMKAVNRAQQSETA
eukprot:2181205-Amphidinium_carterae.2